ncbi:hypothetical protein M378DRAFT_156472 [Amanita muscaria Koide BX008]|uniref:Uncharacterized protein n=1 Tax=Amanita muscaria (strain Koide BX008) TaxID=946122 RepID=A0A0C2X7N1_AMAMK|nr:hypothetical protein M378DRAFT_156472 [Amanita muscaria Koide BX008]
MMCYYQTAPSTKPSYGQSKRDFVTAQEDALCLQLLLLLGPTLVRPELLSRTSWYSVGFLNGRRPGLVSQPDICTSSQHDKQRGPGRCLVSICNQGMGSVRTVVHPQKHKCDDCASNRAAPPGTAIVAPLDPMRDLWVLRVRFSTSEEQLTFFNSALSKEVPSAEPESQVYALRDP